MQQDSLRAFREFEQPSLRRRGLEQGRAFLQDHCLQTVVLGVLVVDTLIIVDKTHLIQTVAEFIAHKLTDVTSSLQNLSNSRR